VLALVLQELCGLDGSLLVPLFLGRALTSSRVGIGGWARCSRRRA